MVKIILLEKLSKDNNIGDLINVKSGYARNFLIPYNKAIYAYHSLKNTKNIKSVIKDKDEEKNILLHLNDLKKKVRLYTPLIIRVKCSKSGKLFGSIKNYDIYNLFLKKIGIDIPIKYFHFSKLSYKYIGKYSIDISLFKEKIIFWIHIIS